MGNEDLELFTLEVDIESIIKADAEICRDGCKEALEEIHALDDAYKALLDELKQFDA